MFGNCHSLEEIDVSNIKISNDGDLSHFFENCTALTTIKGIENWDVKNVSNTYSLFNYCSSLKKLNLNKWDTSNIHYMGYMFANCKSLTSLIIDKWNTKNALRMNGLFNGCESLTSLNINNWNINGVFDMETMFNNCKSLSKLDLSNWNVSNLQKMNSMFSNCSSLTEVDLTNWNTKRISNMSYAFSNCSNLITIYVGNLWNVNYVTEGSNVFSGCLKLQGKIAYDETKTYYKYATTKYYLTNRIPEDAYEPIEIRYEMTINLDETKNIKTLIDLNRFDEDPIFYFSNTYVAEIDEYFNIVPLSVGSVVIANILSNGDTLVLDISVIENISAEDNEKEEDDPKQDYEDVKEEVDKTQNWIQLFIYKFKKFFKDLFSGKLFANLFG